MCPDNEVLRAVYAVTAARRNVLALVPCTGQLFMIADASLLHSRSIWRPA